MKSLVVIGAGGFGRETIDVVEAVNAAASTPVWSLAGVVDDDPSDANLERLARRKIAWLGGLDDYLRSADQCWFVVAIGAPTTRRRIAERLEAAGHEPALLIHPAATVGSEVTLAAGTVVCAGVRVTTNVAIGRHVHLNPNVTVGHDTTLADFVSMNPASTVSGECLIEERVLVGAGAVVLNLRTVAARAVVGAAACVAQDVAPGATVVGVPARELAGKKAR